MDGKFGMSAREHLECVCISKTDMEKYADARQRVKKMFEENDDYEYGAATVGPIDTVLLPHSSNAAVRKQDHLVSSYADRRKFCTALGSSKQMGSVCSSISNTEHNFKSNLRPGRVLNLERTMGVFANLGVGYISLLITTLHYYADVGLDVVVRIAALRRGVARRHATPV